MKKDITTSIINAALDIFSDASVFKHINKNFVLVLTICTTSYIRIHAYCALLQIEYPSVKYSYECFHSISENNLAGFTIRFTGEEKI